MTEQMCTNYAWHIPCGQRAEYALVVACVHEHVREVYDCGRCLARKLAGVTTWCRVCRFGERPHECVLTLLSYKPLAEVSA